MSTRVVFAVAILVVVAGACAAEPVAPEGGTATTTTTADIPVESATTTVLEGEPYVGPGPGEGDLVAVIGVAHDEVVSVRSGPGLSYSTVATLNAEAVDIPLRGPARLLSGAIWYEITTASGSGWLDASLIGLLGSTQDATDEVTGMFGSIPSADSMVTLGRVIAEKFAVEEPPSRIVLVVSPADDSVMTVTYDVVGLGDDSVLGYRFVVTARHSSADGMYELLRVERTNICWRGVTTDGVCL